MPLETIVFNVTTEGVYLQDAQRSFQNDSRQHYAVILNAAATQDSPASVMVAVNLYLILAELERASIQIQSITYWQHPSHKPKGTLSNFAELFSRMLHKKGPIKVYIGNVNQEELSHAFVSNSGFVDHIRSIQLRLPNDLEPDSWSLLNKDLQKVISGASHLHRLWIRTERMILEEEKQMLRRIERTGVDVKIWWYPSERPYLE